MNIKQKIYLVVGAMVLIIVALIVGAIKPLVLDIKKTAAAAGESKDRMISLETIDKNYIAQVEAEYNDVSTNIDLVRAGLVDKSKAVKFFEALESIASSTDNELEINASDFPVLALNLAGDFPALMKFLGTLENGYYFLSVDSININRVGEVEGAEKLPVGEIKTNLKITVYTKE